MEHLITINNLSHLDIPLAIVEKEKWVCLLQAFNENLYESKADLYLPAFFNYLRSCDLEGKSVLDIGCGFGQIGRFIKSLGANVIGIDVIPEAVEEANKVFPAVTGRVERIPFPDDSFDIVVCSMVLMLIENVEMAISEIARVLKPGASALISILNPYYKPDDSQAGISDSGTLSKWVFRLDNRRSVDVSYFHYSYDFYEQLLKRFFSLALYYPSDKGLMLPLEKAQLTQTNTEYLLFQCH